MPQRVIAFRNPAEALMMVFRGISSLRFLSRFPSGLTSEGGARLKLWKT